MEAEGEVPFLILDCGATRTTRRCRAAAAAPVRPARSPRSTPAAPGFHLAAALGRPGRAHRRRRPPGRRAERFFATLGLHVERVGDAPASSSAGSSPSSSTRRASRSARGSARRPTSTPGWSSASTTRAGRWPGATRSGRARCSPCSTACRTEYREERWRPAPASGRRANPGRLTGSGPEVSPAQATRPPRVKARTSRRRSLGARARRRRRGARAPTAAPTRPSRR